MITHSIKYWTGVCGDCGQGQLVIAKSEDQKHFFIICDDCEAEWKNPNMMRESRIPRYSDYKRVKNATLEEIRELGWEKYITGNAIDYECV
jgi:hypothetical protein